MDKDKQEKTAYWIPENISGFWGLMTDKIHDIPVRNWAEGAVAAVLIYMILNPIPFVPKVKLYIMVPAIFTVFLLNLIGFKDESLSLAISGAVSFFRNRVKFYLGPPSAALEEAVGFKQKEPGGKKDEYIPSNIKTDPHLRDRLRHPSQQWLPIEDISDGILTLNIGGKKRYVRFLEIKPINLHMMSAPEQAEVIEGYLDSFIRKAPESFQLFISTNEVDTSSLISHILQSSINDTPKVREMVMDRVRELNIIQSQQDATSKQYIIVYEYEGEEDGSREKEFTAIAASMARTEALMKAGLASCGLKAIAHEREDDFIMEVIYRFLNVDIVKTETVSSRVNRMFQDAVRLQGTPEPVVSFNDFLAPKTLDLSHAGYIIQNGMYRMMLYVEGKSYPSFVEGGWLDVVTRYGSAVNVSVHINKQSRDRVLDRAPMTRANYEADANAAVNKQKSITDIQNARNRLNNFSAIIDKMQRDMEDLYDVCIILTLTAPTLKELQRLRIYVQKDLRSFPLKTNDCLFRHELAYLMALPFNFRDKTLFNKARRNFLSSSLASMFPYTSYEVKDKTGVLFGINTVNNSVVAPDISDTHRVQNMNGIITGSPGSGKTFTELLLASHLREAGCSVFFVLPMKGYEYQRGVARMGGTYIRLWPGSEVCLNLFEVPVYQDPDAEILEAAGIEYNSQPFLAAHMTTIRTFISLLARNALSAGEEAKLDTHLTALYKKAGIMTEGAGSNASVLAFAKSGKPWPTWDDFEMETRGDPAMQNIRNICSPFISPDGSCRNFNGQTNIDLNNKCLAFDIDGINISTALHPALLHLAISLVYSIMRRDQRERTVLFLDEVWQMTKNTYASDFIETIYRLVRGYGGGVISATQDINSFLTVRSSSGNLSSTILNCSAFKIAMKADPNEIDQITGYMKMNAKERNALSKFGRGEGFLIIGADRLPLRFPATQTEIETFTTDPNILRGIRARQLQQAAGGAT